MPDTGAPYFIPYVEPTDLVRDYPAANEAMALAIVAALEDIPVTIKKVDAFTGDGTFVVPAGVTYAIAHMIGGGGGVGRAGSGSGAQSSVDFASGLVVAAGGLLMNSSLSDSSDIRRAGSANSGQGAFYTARAFDPFGGGTLDRPALGGNGASIVAGAAVTPAESITVTVGAGGAAGTNGAAGGSGYVYIEYFEEV